MPGHTYRLEQGRSTTTVNRGVGYLLQALRRIKRKKLIAEIPLFESPFRTLFRTSEAI